jgi:hypothetical protein
MRVLLLERSRAFFNETLFLKHRIPPFLQAPSRSLARAKDMKNPLAHDPFDSCSSRHSLPRGAHSPASAAPARLGSAGPRRKAEQYKEPNPLTPRGVVFCSLGIRVERKIFFSERLLDTIPTEQQRTEGAEPARQESALD